MNSPTFNPLTGEPRVTIIAEAGVNHNGDLKLAKKLVDCAAGAGADFVKFQTFKAERLVTRGATKAQYQIQNSGGDNSQHQMLKHLELSWEAHIELAEHCRKQGIAFLSTAFDEESLKKLVEELAVPVIKIPSGEITNGPLLLQAARTEKPLFVSTGMCGLREIEDALCVLAAGFNTPEGWIPSPEDLQTALWDAERRQHLKQRVVLLHCTTEYPTPLEEANLRALSTLQKTFGLETGYSDHTAGTLAATVAVALGATVIEKHFTLDRNLEGPDHQASLEPDELKRMIQAIRDTEILMGHGRKLPAPVELKNREVARKSLVASAPIRRGEPFTFKNLTAKRPGTGVTPMHFWEYLGRKADRDYVEDELIS